MGFSIRGWCGRCRRFRAWGRRDRRRYGFGFGFGRLPLARLASWVARTRSGSMASAIHERNGLDQLFTAGVLEGALFLALPANERELGYVAFDRVALCGDIHGEWLFLAFQRVLAEPLPDLVVQWFRL